MFDIAVGIVSWNTCELTLKCLASLTAELDRLGVASTVWVIDNASEDGSPEAIAREFPEVVLVCNAENVGFSVANNQFLRGCEARYYLLLNPDTIVHEGALATLVAEIARQPGAGATGPRLVLGDGTIQRSFWELPTLWGELRYNLVYRFYPFGSLFDYLFSRRQLDFDAIRETMPVDALSMACLLIDRRVLAKVGLLSEDYFLFGEENDFFLRMSAAGWQGYYVPSASITHFVGQSRNRNPARCSEVCFFRGRTLFFATHRPEILPRYRLLSAFFLAWSGFLDSVRVALGRADRDSISLNREMKVILDEATRDGSRATKAEGWRAC